ncbi:MAG: phosphotransferase [Nocardioides sp.]
MIDSCAAIARNEQKPTPDPHVIRSIWDDAVAAPRWVGQSLWLHGDLHPVNVLTSDGDLCGVVDFGDMCTGDPAFDLAACWILLPDHETIEHFRSACPLAADHATWRRARGWAIWRASGSLTVATAGQPGGKPSWGPPALASLQRLTESVAERPIG